MRSRPQFADRVFAVGIARQAQSSSVSDRLAAVDPPALVFAIVFRADHALAGPDAFAGPGWRENDPAVVRDPDADRQGIEHTAEQAFAAPQGDLGLLLRADVEDKADGIDDPLGVGYREQRRPSVLRLVAGSVAERKVFDRTAATVEHLSASRKVVGTASH